MKIKNYVWYVKIDYDSPYYILNVISEDKLMIVSCPIGTRTNYIISKGNKFVANVIYWSIQGDNAEKIEIDGKSIEFGMKKEQVIGILGLGELCKDYIVAITCCGNASRDNNLEGCGTKIESKIKSCSQNK